MQFSHYFLAPWYVFLKLCIIILYRVIKRNKYTAQESPHAVILKYNYVKEYQTIILNQQLNCSTLLGIGYTNNSCMRFSCRPIKQDQYQTIGLHLNDYLYDLYDLLAK